MNVSFERFKYLDGKGFYRRATARWPSITKTVAAGLNLRKTHTLVLPDLAINNYQREKTNAHAQARNDTLAKRKKETLKIFNIKPQLHLV